MCAVGDPDQAIYGWRGADIGNIHTFEDDFPERTVVNLERNYRSSGNIVAAAAALIAQNGDRADKTLWTGRGAGAGIKHVRTDSDHEEANTIARIVAAQPEAPRQTAVLYRTNAQSRLIEDGLRRAEIPYHIVGNIRFYEHKEIKNALAYLKVIVNPHDDVSLRRITNSPPRGIGPRNIARAAGSTPGETSAGTLFGPAPGDAGEKPGGRASLWTPELAEGWTPPADVRDELEKPATRNPTIRQPGKSRPRHPIGPKARRTTAARTARSGAPRREATTPGGKGTGRRENEAEHRPASYGAAARRLQARRRGTARHRKHAGAPRDPLQGNGPAHPPGVGNEAAANIATGLMAPSWKIREAALPRVSGRRVGPLPAGTREPLRAHRSTGRSRMPTRFARPEPSGTHEAVASVRQKTP